jgi:hypothetical protein
MSDCKAATVEAERIVEDAVRSGAARVSLAELRISRLPDGLRSLGRQLRELDLSGCWKLTDVSALAALPSLQDLDLRQCNRLEDRLLNRRYRVSTCAAACPWWTSLRSLPYRRCGRWTSAIVTIP